MLVEAKLGKHYAAQDRWKIARQGLLLHRKARCAIGQRHRGRGQEGRGARRYACGGSAAGIAVHALSAPIAEDWKLPMGFIAGKAWSVRC